MIFAMQKIVMFKVAASEAGKATNDGRIYADDPPEAYFEAQARQKP
jgi:hypothetical protein